MNRGENPAGSTVRDIAVLAPETKRLSSDWTEMTDETDHLPDPKSPLNPKATFCFTNNPFY
jgi:hypothetical protein